MYKPAWWGREGGKIKAAASSPNGRICQKDFLSAQEIYNKNAERNDNMNGHTCTWLIVKRMM